MFYFRSKDYNLVNILFIYLFFHLPVLAVLSHQIGLNLRYNLASNANQ